MDILQSHDDLAAPYWPLQECHPELLVLLVVKPRELLQLWDLLMQPHMYWFHRGLEVIQQTFWERGFSQRLYRDVEVDLHLGCIWESRQFSVIGAIEGYLFTVHQLTISSLYDWGVIRRIRWTLHSTNWCWS